MGTKHNQHVPRRNIILLLVVLVGLIVILPQLPAFGDSLATLQNADSAYILLSLLCWVSTFGTAALVYMCLSKQPLSFGKTILIQVASGFTNRLAPSGAGAIATSIRYLVKNGYKPVQASTIVAINNSLGFVGTFLLLVVLLIRNKQPVNSYFEGNIQLPSGWLVAIMVLVMASLSVVIFARRKVIGVVHNIWSTALDIARNPLYLAGALLASIGITIGYALTLYTVALAFNVHVHAVQILLVMALGVAAASITPTPGGIGGAEVGLAAALIAVGVTSHQALTVALIYRLVTYWIAIVPGFIAFQLALRRRYI